MLAGLSLKPLVVTVRSGILTQKHKPDMRKASSLKWIFNVVCCAPYVLAGLLLSKPLSVTGGSRVLNTGNKTHPHLKTVLFKWVFKINRRQLGAAALLCSKRRILGHPHP